MRGRNFREISCFTYLEKKWFSKLFWIKVRAFYEEKTFNVDI